MLIFWFVSRVILEVLTAFQSNLLPPPLGQQMNPEDGGSRFPEMLLNASHIARRINPEDQNLNV
jgi:hypothetical protein